MILDERTEFAADTAVTTSTGTANFGSLIDQTLAVPRMGGDASKQMYLVITVTEAFTTGSTAEVAFQLASDAQDPLATNGTQTINLTTAAYDTGDLALGTQFIIPVNTGDGERYLGLQTIVTTAALTAGKITAGLTLDPKGWKALPDAQN